MKRQGNNDNYFINEILTSILIVVPNYCFSTFHSLYPSKVSFLINIKTVSHLKIRLDSRVTSFHLVHTRDDVITTFRDLAFVQLGYDDGKLVNSGYSHSGYYYNPWRNIRGGR